MQYKECINIVHDKMHHFYIDMFEIALLTKYLSKSHDDYNVMNDYVQINLYKISRKYSDTVIMITENFRVSVNILKFYLN